MAEQIKSCEILCTDGELLRQEKEMIGNEIVRIFDKLVLRNFSNNTDEELFTNEISRYSPCNLQERENPFNEEAYSKCQTDILFGNQHLCTGKICHRAPFLTP